MAKVVVYTSKAALAKACRVSRPALEKWMARDSWVFGNAPWPKGTEKLIAAWRSKQDMQENRADDPGKAQAGSGNNSLSTVRVQKLLREIESLDIDNSERRGELHSVVECEAHRKALNLELKNSLMMFFPTAVVQALERYERDQGRRPSNLESLEVVRTQVEIALAALSGR